MRGRGITYDTGFVGRDGISRARFEPAEVRDDLRVIRDELHCTAVRVTGGVPDRIELAAAAAAELGLEVWYSPYPLDRSDDEMLTLFVDCAGRAERLRAAGHPVVYVAGAELSLMGLGFLPGATVDELVATLLSRPANLGELVAAAATRVNEFLARALPAIRTRFGGPVTYASVPIDRVDWSLFDIVSSTCTGRPRSPISSPTASARWPRGASRWRSRSSAARPTGERRTSARRRSTSSSTTR